MPRLVLGPLLRYVSATETTVWVETDAPCEVEVLGRSAPTFQVAGHHYGLIAIGDLEPGGEYEYGVTLDGEPHWPDPEAGFPPSVIRTLGGDGPLRIVFGSCRVAAPHDEPYCLPKDQDPKGREVCALYALAHRMAGTERSQWPHQLLMIGDQVYVDEDAPQTREFIRSRRDTSKPPYEEVADFEEYTRLYWESWGEPWLRWLLSTVPTATIFDDHDVHDDWNTSASWVREMDAQPWWHERIEGALMSYWLYQHLGNLSPAELDANETLRDVRQADDAGGLLREFARTWDHRRNGSRWSYARALGRTKLVVFDSREGRTLDEGERCMFDEPEWEWLQREVTGDFEHLLLVDTLPVLMTPAFHYIEAWNEAVCAGAWGKFGEKLLGERLRRALDLEHWAAFGKGFKRLVGLVEEVAAGRRGTPPRTIVMLGGDVHHAYLAEVALRRGVGARSRVYQAVCSPFRNPLDRHERAIARLGGARAAIPIARMLARAAGVEDPPLRWRLTEPPTFDNQFATLELNGARARLRIEKTVPGGTPAPRIETSLERELAA